MHAKPASVLRGLIGCIHNCNEVQSATTPKGITIRTPSIASFEQVRKVAITESEEPEIGILLACKARLGPERLNWFRPQQPRSSKHFDQVRMVTKLFVRR